MQRRRILTVGLCGLMAISLGFFSASQVRAASGNGPYYAEPAWSQKLLAATRFVVLTDWNSEAVLDRETGLVWQRSLFSDVTSWTNAKESCSSVPLGGRTGWRLPSLHELMSLVDPSVSSPSPKLPSGHPFLNIPSGFSWSSTKIADTFAGVYSVSFQTGWPARSTTSEAFPYWCVRGANTADQY